MSDDLLEPPKEAILAGYNMMRAREAALKPGGYYQQYLADAINCVVEAAPKVVAMSDAHYFDSAAILEKLHGAAAVLGNPNSSWHEWHMAANRIGGAHRLASRIMAKAGFREITDRDFAVHGAGSGR